MASRGLLEGLQRVRHFHGAPGDRERRSAFRHVISVRRECDRTGRCSRYMDSAHSSSTMRAAHFVHLQQRYVYIADLLKYPISSVTISGQAPIGMNETSRLPLY